MRRIAQKTALFLLALHLATGGNRIPAAFPRDHSQWNTLLKRYVNTEGRVDYQGWTKTGKQELEAYLQSLAPPWPADLNPASEKSALINSYNALTVYWVLVNYPVRSIWQTDHPFSAARHVIDGRKMSLDEIETRLRAMDDPRIHAALVCAARSCPPLRREAYVPDRLSAQLDDNARTWLRNTALNTFSPDRRLAQVSMIFKWYAADFGRGGGSVEKFLAEYAPPGTSRFLHQTSFRIDYKAYNWGLNDTSALGSDYSQIRFLWDYFRNRI